jgi:hypothetical protein
MESFAAGPSLLAAAGSYVSWGPIQISITNLAIVGLMVLVFLAALVVPFGRDHEGRGRR